MASLSGNLATMGPGVPYAIAAKFAHPDRPVIALVGDGAMQMNGINELITIAKYWQRLERPAAHRAGAQQPRPQPGDLGAARDGGRPASSRPRRTLPDFPYARYARAARADGHPRRRARRRSAPPGTQALAADRPVVLEAVTDPDVPPLPPHITLEQAKAMTSRCSARATPTRGRIVQQTLQGQARRLRAVAVTATRIRRVAGRRSSG